MKCIININTCMVVVYFEIEVSLDPSEPVTAA